MIAARDEETGVGLDNQLIQDISYTFLIAAIDTTAISLSWILLMFAKVRFKRLIETLFILGIFTIV